MQYGVTLYGLRNQWILSSMFVSVYSNLNGFVKGEQEALYLSVGLAPIRCNLLVVYREFIHLCFEVCTLKGVPIVCFDNRQHPIGGTYFFTIRLHLIKRC